MERACRRYARRLPSGSRAVLIHQSTRIDDAPLIDPHRRVVPDTDSERQCYPQQHDDQLPQTGYGAMHPDAAIQLVADRLSIPKPGAAGRVNMLNALPFELSSFYADPARVLWNPARDEPRVLRKFRPSANAAPGEWPKCVRAMDASGMIGYLPKAAVRVVNGVFGVAKDASQQRFIMDARPFNQLCVKPLAVDLITPEHLAQLELEPNAELFVAKSDLSDFFYSFAVPEWMHGFLAMPGVRAGDVGQGERFGADTIIHPHLTVLAMGWSHSVCVAQSSHTTWIGRDVPLLPECNRITSTSDLRVDRVRYGVYIDDVIMLGTDKDEVIAAHDQYRPAAAANLFGVKLSKDVIATNDGVICLGVEIHGQQRTVGVTPEQLATLCAATRAMVASGSCTGHELAHLVGKWTWAMLVRRPALSVFNAVYRFIDTAGPLKFNIWRSVACELLTAAKLAPLLFTTLGAGWFDRVIATDACESGMGVVTARVPHSEVLASAALAGVVVNPDRDTEAVLNAPLLPPVTEWTTAFVHRWRDPGEHINSLELRAVDSAMRWLVKSPTSIGRRVLLLCDSTVAVATLSKGRSSSSLRHNIRQIAALLLSTGIQPFVRWIATELNPADGPSRTFDKPHSARY